MSGSLFKIAGGTVYDPANGIDGQVRDLWIADGKIVAARPTQTSGPTRTLDARGLVVMPGGIDMHCHIAGPKVNVAPQDAARGKAPRPRPCCAPPTTHSGTMGSVPSTFATGYKYAGLGYTTAFDAADAAAGRPARPRGVRRHALHRQGLLRPDGQQSLRHAGDPGERARAAEGVPRLAARLGQGLRPQAGQSRRRRGLEAAAGGQRAADLDSHGRSLRRHARGRSSQGVARPPTSCACPTRCTSTATTWACPATGRRRSRR